MKKYKPIQGYSPRPQISTDEVLLKLILKIAFLAFALLLAYSIWGFYSDDTSYAPISQGMGHLSKWVTLYNVLKFGGLLMVIQYWKTAKLTRDYHWAVWMRIFLPYESAWAEYVDHYDRKPIKGRVRATYLFLAFVIALNLLLKLQVNMMQKDMKKNVQESDRKIEELSKIMKKR